LTLHRKHFPRANLQGFATFQNTKIIVSRIVSCCEINKKTLVVIGADSVKCNAELAD
jgi:hypothetical protein